MTSPSSFSGIGSQRAHGASTYRCRLVFVANEPANFVRVWLVSGSQIKFVIIGGGGFVLIWDGFISFE